MRHKVKVLSANYEKDLENALNAALNHLADAEIVDIKFSTSVSFDTGLGSSIDRYSAMIIYTE